MSTPLLTVEHLRVEYRQGSFPHRMQLPAVRDVSFTLAEGDTLGIVGESGCGKTTLGRAVLGLEQAAAGMVAYRGRTYTAMNQEARRQMRHEMGMVFQDSAGALNPRRTVLESVAAPLKYRGISLKERQRRAAEALTAAGLAPAEWEKYPHALSGGQRQRASIARAVVGEPKLLVCDEAVSALDGMLRRQILALLHDLQQRTGTALLFISHDLNAVRSLCRSTAVMYLGRFVETGETEAVFRTPQHPYTKALLESVPLPDPLAPVPPPLKGETPSPGCPPSGCPFHPRCPQAMEECARSLPKLKRTESGGRAACLLRKEI